MTAYETQLYSFITKRENFEPFLDMYDQYEKVRRRLIEEFWTAVYEKVKELTPDNAEWKPVLEPETASNRKLRMVHRDMQTAPYKAGIIYEFLDGDTKMGVHFNRALIADGSMQNIFAEAEAFVQNPNTPGWSAGSGGWWFAIYKRPGQNFSNKTSLLHILPEVRESLVEAYAQYLISAVDQLGNFCIEQAKKY